MSQISASAPEILMLGPMGPIERGLEPEHSIERLWLYQDRAAFLAEVGPRIRVVIGYSGTAPVDLELIEALPALELIGIMGAGYETVDIEAAISRGIAVTNAGSSNAVDVAEHALGLALDVARSISAADRYVRAGNWKTIGRMRPTRRFSGRRMGILGLGNIGLEIARLATSFNMPVAYHNRRQRMDVDYRYCPDLITLAQDSEILVVAAPGGDETRHLVGRAVLDALGPTGILVNIGRGSVVDEIALIAALEEGRLGGAGLDVFEAEPDIPERLLALPNVVLQPHQGGATEEGIMGAIEVLIANVRAYFAGQALTNRVA